MYWNHRLIRHGDGRMEIAEVIYVADGEMRESFGWSEATVEATLEDDPSQMESLRQQVEWFRRALDKPPLPALGCKKSCCVVGGQDTSRPSGLDNLVDRGATEEEKDAILKALND